MRVFLVVFLGMLVFEVILKVVRLFFVLMSSELMWLW